MTTPNYQPTASSLFASAARSRVVTVWHYCEVCQRQVQYQFVRDDGRYEVYVCPTCRVQKGWAVR